MRCQRDQLRGHCAKGGRLPGQGKAERKQFPLVLCKATTIHKSQAATYHDGAHCRLDSTVTQEGQACVALSRCPTRAHCILERFNPSCLKWNANAEWALTQLRAQQADRSGSLLWQQLMKPRETRQFYVKRVEELGEPEWRRQSHEGQEDGAGAALTAARRLPTRRPASKPIGASARPRKASKPKGKAKPKSKARPKTKARQLPQARRHRKPQSSRSSHQEGQEHRG